MRTQKTVDQRIEGYLGMTYEDYVKHCRYIWFEEPCSRSDWRLMIARNLYERDQKAYEELMNWGQT